MSKTVVFCSDRRIPNEDFPLSKVIAVASSLGGGITKSFVSDSKSTWKQFLEDPEVTGIVLVGVDNPNDYEVPAEGLTPISSVIEGELVPCQFQVMEKKGILMIPPLELA